jgi:hypothetical protein
MSQEAEEPKAEEKPEEPVSHEVPLMTEDQLREFVLGLSDCQIFTSRHIRPDDQDRLLGSVFLTVGLGAYKDWTKEELEPIGALWEWYRAAGPRSINGYPCFFSHRVIHKDDWARAHKAYEAEVKRRKNIKI